MSRASIFIILLFAIGVIIRWIILSEGTKTFADGDLVRFQTRVLVSPKEESGLQKFRVTPKGYEDLRIITSAYPHYSYGEHVRIHGKINVTTFENGDILYSSYFPEIEKVEDENVLFGLTRFIRERVSEAFTSLLPPTSASLLLGIVFGVKEGIPQDFEKALQTTGVFHVIAASGMNVSMLAGFLMAVLSRFLRRQAAIIVSILCIGFYTVLAGLEPSIVRASVMATIAFTAMLLGRQGTALWSLTLTALLMLLVDPFLVEDIGFQLSFAATLGILLIKPLLVWSFIRQNQNRGTTPSSGDGPLKDQNTERNPTLALLSEDLGSTVSAQIATIPILLFYFHQYGLLSILINALILWTIPPLMILGSVAAIVSFIVPPIASLITLLALPFLWLFETVVMTLDAFNPVVEVETISFVWVFGYYAVLSGIILLKKKGSRGSLNL